MAGNADALTFYVGVATQKSSPELHHGLICEQLVCEQTNLPLSSPWTKLPSQKKLFTVNNTGGWGIPPNRCNVPTLHPQKSYLKEYGMF